MIISNSSPLICISKIGQLDLLQKLYEEVLIPGAVYQEVVVDGNRLHKAGVKAIENAIRSEWIKVVSLESEGLANAEKYRTSGEIGKGEAEAIALAQRLKLRIILDDKYARELANLLGLGFQGTAAVLLEAFFAGLLGRNDFIVSLRELAKVMWLSPEVIAEILRLSEVTRK